LSDFELKISQKSELATLKTPKESRVGEPLNRKRGRSGTGSAAENAEYGLMVGIVFILKVVLGVFWVKESD
jgi:hypothetical protein